MSEVRRAAVIASTYGHARGVVTSCPELSILSRAQVNPSGLFKIIPFPA